MLPELAIPTFRVPDTGVFERGDNSNVHKVCAKVLAATPNLQNEGNTCNAI